MTTDDDSIDLQHALRRGHDLAVLEDGRTVPMRRDADGDARLYYDMPALRSPRRGWYYRATGRWCAEDGDAEKRERHPRVVATLASAGADDEIVLDDTTSPETARKIGRLALRYGMGADRLRGLRPDLVTGDDCTGRDDEPNPLQPGDYVLLDDLDGPEHLARVAQAMLTGYPGAWRRAMTAKCLDEPRHDWWYHHNVRALVVGIDSRDDEVWGMPDNSNALHRRRSPDDVLRAARARPETGHDEPLDDMLDNPRVQPGIIPRVNGRRIVTRYPEPDDEVAITFVNTGDSAGQRVVRATGRDYDGTPCVWLDGDADDAFRWHGDRFTYRGEGDVVLVEEG